MRQAFCTSLSSLAHSVVAVASRFSCLLAVCLYCSRVSFFLHILVLDYQCALGILGHFTSRLKFVSKCNKSYQYSFSMYGCRAFNYAGPTVWNSLPDELINSDSFDSFKWFMKTIETILFTAASLTSALEVIFL